MGSGAGVQARHSEPTKMQKEQFGLHALRDCLGSPGLVWKLSCQTCTQDISLSIVIRSCGRGRMGKDSLSTNRKRCRCSIHLMAYQLVCQSQCWCHTTERYGWGAIAEGFPGSMDRGSTHIARRKDL